MMRALVSESFHLSLVNKWPLANFISSSRNPTLVSPSFVSVSEGSTSQKDVEKLFAHFQYDKYVDHLKTKTIGRSVLLMEQTSTTMDDIEPYKNSHGFAVITLEQTDGRGRGSNVWISPKGCAMFTISVVIEKSSPLFTRLSLMQHIMSLSLVDSIKNISGDHAELDIGIKWPNDLYGKSKVEGDKWLKLGGVLVKCSMENSKATCLIGVGFNVDNDEPVLCLNSLIRELKEQKELDIPPLSTAEVIARCLTRLEHYLKLCDEINGLDLIRKNYLINWIHRGQKVNITQSDDPNQDYVIENIDSFGFLVARNVKTGEEVSLQPDGNSLDIMSNLIRTKT